MTLSPAVWFHFAKVMHVNVENRGDIPARTLVIREVLMRRQRSLIYMPTTAQARFACKSFDQDRVRICVLSGAHSEGCGKTHLISVFVSDFFSDEVLCKKKGKKSTVSLFEIV
jgi:hypothetical protein